jgi:hypothetical protein
VVVVDGARVLAEVLGLHVLQGLGVAAQPRHAVAVEGKRNGSCLHILILLRSN